MSVLIARHALSRANTGELLAFTNGQAPLINKGLRQARRLRPTLEDTYGIDVTTTPVAVSELRRSQETAYEAGFEKRVIHALLNEIIHGMQRDQWRAMIAAGRLPAAAIERAEQISENPPPQPVWIGHGAVIAGLCVVHGVSDQYETLIPKFCEVRELPIDIPGAS